MRKRWMVLTLSMGVALAAQASAFDVHVHNEQCGYDSNYDIQVESAGIDFRRASGEPTDVFMHDGRLRVDGRPVAVSATDADRLRQYEQQTRELLPQMAGIAREAIGIGFDAMATVAATLGGSQHHRDKLVDRLNHERRAALRQLDTHLSASRWDTQGLDSAIEQPVTDAADELAHSVTGSVLWSVLTGRASEVEARADSIDQSIDKVMKQRSDQLEARAKAVCPRLKAMDQLQQQLGFRLPDGTPLQLISPNRESDNKAGQLAAR